MQLQEDLKKIEATGTKVVSISYDSVGKLRAFSDDRKITFPLLSDEGSKTIKAYGIQNKNGYPHPGTYVVDKTGTVKAALFLKSYRKRHDTDQLIKAIKGAK